MRRHRETLNLGGASEAQFQLVLDRGLRSLGTSFAEATYRVVGDATVLATGRSTDRREFTAKLELTTSVDLHEVDLIAEIQLQEDVPYEPAPEAFHVAVAAFADLLGSYPEQRFAMEHVLKNLVALHQTNLAGQGIDFVDARVWTRAAVDRLRGMRSQRRELLQQADAVRILLQRADAALKALGASLK